MAVLLGEDCNERLSDKSVCLPHVDLGVLYVLPCGRGIT